MPIEIVSLLSSPENRAPKRPLESLGSPKESAVCIDGSLPGQSKRPLGQEPSRSVPGVVILSDDFDSTWDPDDLGNDFPLPAPKVPRLSERETSPRAQNSKQQRAVSAATTAAKLKPAPAASRRWQSSALEPIDLSSSPVSCLTVSKDRPISCGETSLSSLSAGKTTARRGLHASSDEFERNPFASSSPQVRELPLPKVAEWDPISSSAPEVHQDRLTQPSRSRCSLQRSQSEVIAIHDSDDDARLPSSEDEFPDIAHLGAPKFKALSALTRHALSETQAKAPRRSKAATSKTTDEKELVKEQRAAEREAERERKQREKQRAKQEKAAEKQKAAALAEVNKVRTDKKISTPEMIVDLPASLEPTLLLQAQTLLKDLDVETATHTSPVENVVKWRRKVKARFNDEMGHWEPIPPRIDHERYAMPIVSAVEFVELATGAGESDLAAHVDKMKQYYPDHDLVYMIQGLGPWIRNNRNIRNRQFVSAVRNGLTENPSAPASGQAPVRRRKNNATQQEYIDEDRIEDALLELQVLHGALIHHTSAAVETAQWVAVFTQHISTVPYRRQREQTNASTAAFCMESGQVRTGDGARDTYVRMLQEVARVTAPIAYGIAGEFETVSKLVRGLEEGGPLTLEAVRKSANKDGALSDRTIGQAVSRRLHKIFTGTDETSMDV
ncbi:hypothetical protein GQ53DRAFT_741880 [Thozetella sp. PMI_491]|nr:hypothetical protein GQ53DRAFT_741880 [Thozetella sp. PMI_491]